MTRLHSPLFYTCLVLALSACAPTMQRPAVESKSTKPSAKIQFDKKSASAETRRTESNTAEPGSVRAATEPLTPRTVSSELYLAQLGEVHGLSAEQIRRELAELNTGKRLDRAQRFRLAVLLSRDEHGDWARALKALDGSADESDPRTHALVDMLRKSLRTRLDLRHQTARVAELQQRIEQIKALEKDLLHRNGSPKTP